MFSNGMVERSQPTWGFSQAQVTSAVPVMEWVAERTRSIERSDVSFRSHVATITVYLDWPDGRQKAILDCVGFGDLDLVDVRDAMLELTEGLSWTPGRAPVSSEIRGHGSEKWR